MERAVRRLGPGQGEHFRTAPAELAAQTGLGLGPSKARTFSLAAVAWISVPAFAALTLALSVALGLVTLDLSGLSLYRDTMGVQGGDLQTAWVSQVVTGFTLCTVVTMIPAFGEEWGWRGWLVPWLSSEAGVSRGLLISGLIWGLWHAPLTLLGYNYPNLGAWAALVFIGFCVTFGLVIGWLRLRTGSIWPAVVAHAAFNATVPTFLMLGDATTPPNFAIAGPTGVAGWAVLGLLAAALLEAPSSTAARTDLKLSPVDLVRSLVMPLNLLGQLDLAPGPCRRATPQAPSSPFSALVSPSWRPSSRSAWRTQVRIDCAEGWNSLASSSGVRPARTSSTVCRRNSGG
ncbi:CPBP family intramembrane glutamic endopeptidase [Nonomuraea diastatica]|uniref:CPBP family intramembrane metalloprotease n=1 Tax=Nonomuraea diastatica TaxID=1848329 RepID=A0A4R4X3D5_9ACTN|nr:CPBP family intramembrane metalloprotease [Nonomuraea diastatica]